MIQRQQIGLLTGTRVPVNILNGYLGTFKKITALAANESILRPQKLPPNTRLCL